MNKISIVIVSILLISCSNNNSDTTTVNCIANDSSSAAVTQDSIRILLHKDSYGKPFEGVVVQLDDKDVCVKSNADGVATFNAVSSGSHDVHVFSPVGYNWYSEYGISGGTSLGVILSDYSTQTSPPVSSYISLEGTMTNHIAGNNITFVLFSNNGTVVAQANSTINMNNYTLDFNINTPAGTQYTGDILVLEYHNNTTTGEYYLVDKAVIPTSTFTTKANKGIYVTKNVPVFNNLKPAVSNLLSFNSITIPSGHTVSGIYIENYVRQNESSANAYQELFSQYSNFDLTSPVIFKSYLPFTSPELFFHLSTRQGSQNYNTTWGSQKKYQKTNATNIVFAPQLNIPVFPANQVGSQITWSTVNANISYQSLFISDLNFSASSRDWDIYINNNDSLLKLPEIPKNITPLLTKGTKYRVSLSGSINNTATRDRENYSVNSNTWTY